MKNRIRLLVAFFALPSIVAADSVVLKSDDGFVDLEGEIVTFDGNLIEFRSSVGTVKIPSEGIVCFGTTCPPELAASGTTEDVVVSVNDREVATFMGSLLAEHADRFNGAVTRVEPAPDRPVLEVSYGRDGDAEGIQLFLAAPDPDLAVETQPAFSGGYFPLGNWAAVDMAPNDHVLGLTAFVAVTSPDVDVDAISIADIAAIYAGEITNWAELGGPDIPVKTLLREPASRARADFEQMVMIPNGKSISDAVTSTVSDAWIASTVSQYSGAIGITNPIDIGAARPLGIAGSCGIVSEPDLFSIKTGAYPLIRALVATQSQPLPALGNSIIDFAISVDAQSRMTDVGFFGQEVELEDPARRQRIVDEALNPATEVSNPAILSSMVQNRLTMQRLTSTFRFAAGANIQNAWGRAEFSRLSGFLESAAFEGSEVFFVGFSGADTDAGEALAESAELAEVTMAAFLDYAPQFAQSGARASFDALGYGGVNKVACSEDSSGANVNRRVEVWVR